MFWWYEFILWSICTKQPYEIHVWINNIELSERRTEKENRKFVPTSEKLSKYWRAASSRTSSRHIYISYIEFMVLIHIINSYTKFIVLIHIINLQFFWSNLNQQAGLSKSLGVSMFIHCMNSYYEICTWINYMVK